MSIQIIAHRGASGMAPENTLAAFQLAWKLGAHGIEFDVHLASDGVPVVIHDDDTARVAGVKAVVAQTSSEKLKRLDVGRWKDGRYTGERIPTLEEALDSIPASRSVLIELKAGDPQGLTAFTATALDDRPMVAEHAVLMSFDERIALAAKKACPDRPVLWLWEGDHASAFIPALEAHVLAGRLDGVGMCVSAAKKGNIVTPLRGFCRVLSAWTVNDPELAKPLESMGFQFLTTDYPERFISGPKASC